MSDQAAAPRSLELSPGERVLRLLADVRAGEGLIVVMMALTLFLILSSYYLLKTIRESLILTQGGAATKTYSSAGQALLLLFLVPAFAAIASRVDRMRLIRWVTLFFVGNIVVFFALGRAGLHLGIPFFIWVGIFNMMVPSQFWAFANDIYTPDQGKRLFAIVGTGSSLGAVAGALYARHFMRALGPYNLMLVSAGILACCVVAAEFVNARQGRVRPSAAAEAAAPIGKSGAFELLFKDRYLMLIAALFVVLNLVNTSGEYMLSRLVVAESIARFGSDAASVAARETYVGEFYGSFFSSVNVVSLLLQMLGVSRIIKLLGVGGALYVHPSVALLGSVSVLAMPSLKIVGVAKVLDNSTDYSLGNTTRQALWLPTSREAKYKAKQAVDSFFVRSGDVLSALLVFVAESLKLALPAFAAVNIGLALVWMLIVSRLSPENRRRMDAAQAQTPTAA